MRVKTIVYEDFINYKIPSMFIGTSKCGGKCCIEAGIPLSVCQNDGWRKNVTLDIPDDEIIKRYLLNDITKAICIGGLEPFEQFDEVFDLISKLRNEYMCYDDVVIYTGYNSFEIVERVEKLKQMKNIVIKYGRYIPGYANHYDDELGVYLSSDNQYAERIC